MARLYRGIVQSLKEPSDKEVIWIKGKSFFHYNNGEWTQLHIPKAEEISYILKDKDYDITNIGDALDILLQLAAENKEKDEEILATNELLSYKVDTVEKKVSAMSDVSTFYKGRFSTVEDLKSAYPKAQEGSYAHVGTNSPYAVWLFAKPEGWYDSGETHDYLPYYIVVKQEEELEYLEKNNLLEDGVIYLGTEQK